MILARLIFILCSISSALALNHVSNHDFSITAMPQNSSGNCPQSQTTPGNLEIEKALTWSLIRKPNNLVSGTPDFFHQCNDIFFQEQLVWLQIF